jgi:hypothetical protein
MIAHSECVHQAFKNDHLYPTRLQDATLVQRCCVATTAGVRLLLLLLGIAKDALNQIYAVEN